MLPFVSCLCPTYGRPPHYQFLLEEAIESFIRQDYPEDRRELIVYNDCATQGLMPAPPTDDKPFPPPGIRFNNGAKRCASLGGKYNEMVDSLSVGQLLLPWEDDDISLGWRISQAVEMLGDADYWRPPGYIFNNRGQLFFLRDQGVRHSASIFRRSAWQQVGGYPHVSGAQDHGMDSRLREACRVAPEGDVPPERWAYRYNWGVQPVHLSGRRDSDTLYEEIGRAPVTPGTFVLRPHWRADYQAEIAAALAAERRP
jgi:hypothetical protein